MNDYIYIHTYIPRYMHEYIHTYVRRYIHLFHALVRGSDYIQMCGFYLTQPEPILRLLNLQLQNAL
jgi:hypothetical protein